MVGSRIALHCIWPLSKSLLLQFSTIFTLGPLRAPRVLSSPEPSVCLASVLPSVRLPGVAYTNRLLYRRPFCRWLQCYHSKLALDVRIGLTAIEARFFKQSISNFTYTLLGYGARALSVFRQIQQKLGHLWTFSNCLVAEGCCRSLNALLYHTHRIIT